MFDKLDGVEQRFEEVNHQLQDPNVTQDQKKFRGLMKEMSELQQVVTSYRRFKELKKQLADSRAMIESEKDEELKQMAKEELAQLSKDIEIEEEQLKILLLPKDPNDDKNIILEIRAGAGGDEASLFAHELFRAYTLFAAKKGWQVELMSTSPGNAGGYKEVIGLITGDQVYSRLKYESGVHRVQRVPETETQGRVHTSTVTVAVLPEVDEVDININPNDIKTDVFRSGGAGGQSVNTTDSAVRITHIPSGLVVICQDERSQIKNKSKALKVLYARLVDAEKERAIKSASEARVAQIGTGDRSERIRTYNFPQSRITDHRIGLTMHQIEAFMGGEVNLLTEPLATHYQTEALKGDKN